MSTQDWFSLVLFLAWCAVAFCEGALFGFWLADREHFQANDKDNSPKPPSPGPSGHPLPSDGRGAGAEDAK
jgi:hypothetical protein